jgi:hypothetical protein
VEERSLLQSSEPMIDNWLRVKSSHSLCNYSTFHNALTRDVSSVEIQSEVMILGEMCVLSLIYSHVAVCKFCVVFYLICICFYLLFSNHSTCFLIFFLCWFFVLYFCFLFCVFCVFVLFGVLFLLLYCLFPISVPVYRPLLPGGNPIAVNK